MQETRAAAGGTVTSSAVDVSRLDVRPDGPSRRDRWFPLIVFGLVAGAMVVLSVAAYQLLPHIHKGHRLRPHHWARAFEWWDGWWYTGIAQRGYFAFSRRSQTPVAFFPAYPLSIRFLGSLTGQGPLLAGVGLTLACGLGSVTLFYRWCLARLDRPRAQLAVLLLVLYPFAFYLMGAVYADALFIFATLAAFLAVEADRTVLAGLCCAVATATRPVGVAVVVAVWVRWWQLRVLRGGPLRKKDLGLLLAPAGLLLYCLFLWVKFGHPFAFLEAESAIGWGQGPGVSNALKLRWWHLATTRPLRSGAMGHLVANTVPTVLGLAAVPFVFRKFGRAYGLYVIVAVGGTALMTKDFVGMGRYVLAAFPCFAAAADLLVTRRRLTWAVLAVSAGFLVLFTQLHARGTILS